MRVKMPSISCFSYRLWGRVPYNLIFIQFEKYIKLFLRDGMTGYAYEDCGARWEIGAILANHLYSDEEELPEERDEQMGDQSGPPNPLEITVDDPSGDDNFTPEDFLRYSES